MNTIFRRLIAVGSVSALVLLASACGGDEAAPIEVSVTSVSPTASSQQTAITEAPQPECVGLEQEILIGWTPLLSFFPIKWAVSGGYYEAEGLTNVEFVEFQGGAPAAAAMLSGSIQFILTSAERPLLLAESADAGVKNVMSMTNASDMAVVGRVGTGIEPGDIQSLRGKKIGITAAGGGFDKTLRLLLRENGIDPDKDVSILEVGGVSTAVASVRAGQVDAVMYGEPAVSQLLQIEGTFLVAALAADFPSVSQLSFAGMQSTDKFIETNVCVVEAMVRAGSQAAADLAQETQPATAIEVMLAQFGGETPDSVLIDALKSMSNIYGSQIEMSTALKVIDALEREGTIPSGKYSPDDFVAFQFAEAWKG